ncbi:hypothetical protein GVN24_29955 [Rhizobium sp. CRIBSB]|nr:hypothetical protein [Rhizobium sp. CRIBSB]
MNQSPAQRLAGSGNGGRAVRRGPNRLEGITVGFGAFLLLFQSTSLGVLISLAGLGVFFVAGARSALLRSVKAYGITYFEMVMAVISAFSALAYYYVGSDISAQFTVLFAITAVSTSLIARGHSAEAIFKWAAISHLIMIIVIALIQPVEIIGALNPANAATRWSSRLRPFGLHPNLVGMIFSGAVIMFLYGFATNRGRMKLLFGAATAVSIALVLAASARGGLMALVLSIVVMGVIYFRRFIAPHPRMIILTIAGSIILLSLIAGPVTNYIATVLELNSETRGLQTGGSGRVERWLASLEYIENGTLQLFIGSGLRTIGEETLGFTSTENSYLNIAIENGLFVFVACVFLFVGGIIRLYQRSMADPNPVWVFMAWLLIYICIQSFFNRYLLAIGNSLSFYVLLVTAIAWLPSGNQAAVRTPRQRMPWETLPPERVR